MINELNKEAILVIREYLADHDKPGRYFWRKEFFEQYSYSKWACKELISRIQTREDSRPIDIIEEFIDEMDKYSYQVGLRAFTGSFTFSVAKDTAEDILDVFLAMR